jgi:hypothetical protein
MPLPDDLRAVVEELANALQAAGLLAALLRRNSETAASDAAALEQSIVRAAAAVRRLRPSQRSEQP